MKPIHWINSAGGDFTDAADWSGGAVPGAGDDAVIDAAGSYTVTLSSAETVRSLILNDAAATVSLDSGAMLSLGSNLTLKAGIFQVSGTISGGTLSAKRGMFEWQGGVLDGGTYDGPLRVAHHGVLLIGPNGLNATGPGGAGAGTVDISRGGGLHFEGTQTFDNATINMNNGYIFAGDNMPTAMLTLGPNIIINQTGPGCDLAGAQIVNQGVINVGSRGDTFFLQTSFTNQGLIKVFNGGAFYFLSFSEFNNLVNGTLTGGSYEVDSGSGLQLADNKTVVTDDADITVSGAGSIIQSYNTSTRQEVPIESTLTTIGAAGTLKLLAGRDWTSTLDMANQGTLVLGGGTFTATSLTNDGLFRGRGKINVAITDGGTIEAANGTLDLTRAITGNGALQVNAKAILKVEAAAAASLTTTFSGVGGNLKLGDAAEFAATIAGFAAGDIIDLLGQAADSATLQAGDQLVVKNGSQTVATLQLSGDYGGAAFAVASDGRGGSNITVSTGLLAQAVSSMAGAPAGNAGQISEAWRPHPPMLAGPHAMMV